MQTPSDMSKPDRQKAVALRALGSTLAEVAEAVGVSPAALRQAVARGRRGEGGAEMQLWAVRMTAAAEDQLTQGDLVRMLENEAREERGSLRRQNARTLLLRIARERDKERAILDQPPTPLQELMRELRRPRTAGELASGAAKQEAWEKEQRERADEKANQKGLTP